MLICHIQYSKLLFKFKSQVYLHKLWTTGNSRIPIQTQHYGDNILYGVKINLAPCKVVQSRFYYISNSY